MRAFLEKEEKQYFDDYVFCARTPLINLGVEVVDFDGNGDLSAIFDRHNVNPNDIVFGSVQACEMFFFKCYHDIPKYIGYPKSLELFYGRRITETKAGLLPKEYPYFVKPRDGVKAFTGSLVENDAQLKILMDYDVKDKYDYPLYMSEPVKFFSEFRCFVHKGKLEGIQHYAGDFRIFPSVERIQLMIDLYENPNIAYTLDVGLVESGYGREKYETVLVEVNDMWAIGSYGFDAKKYVRMTIDRFLEISKTSKHR